MNPSLTTIKALKVPAIDIYDHFTGCIVDHVRDEPLYTTFDRFLPDLEVVRKMIGSTAETQEVITIFKNGNTMMLLPSEYFDVVQDLDEKDEDYVVQIINDENAVIHTIHRKYVEY
jgi:hypothetical protein